MKKKSITATFKVYENLEELPDDIQNLMRKAFKARDNAYAPYSNFQVGAAVLLESGEVVLGSNQENASYPTGLCAERTAIFSAGANFPDENIQAIALSAKSEKYEVNSPTPPCGACRQAIAEYENKQNQPIEIYFMGESGNIVQSTSVADLLPLSFKKQFLER